LIRQTRPGAAFVTRPFGHRPNPRLQPRSISCSRRCRLLGRQRGPREKLIETQFSLRQSRCPVVQSARERRGRPCFGRAGITMPARLFFSCSGALASRQRNGGTWPPSGLSCRDRLNGRRRILRKIWTFWCNMCLVQLRTTGLVVSISPLPGVPVGREALVRHPDVPRRPFSGRVRPQKRRPHPSGARPQDSHCNQTLTL
jgi:hypothetical protein